MKTKEHHRGVATREQIRRDLTELASRLTIYPRSGAYRKGKVVFIHLRALTGAERASVVPKDNSIEVEFRKEPAETESLVTDLEIEVGGIGPEEHFTLDQETRARNTLSGLLDFPSALVRRNAECRLLRMTVPTVPERDLEDLAIGLRWGNEERIARLTEEGIGVFHDVPLDTECRMEIPPTVEASDGGSPDDGIILLDRIATVFHHEGARMAATADGPLQPRTEGVVPHTFEVVLADGVIVCSFRAVGGGQIQAVVRSSAPSISDGGMLLQVLSADRSRILGSYMLLFRRVDHEAGMHQGEARLGELPNGAAIACLPVPLVIDRSALGSQPHPIEFMTTAMRPSNRKWDITIEAKRTPDQIRDTVTGEAIIDEVVLVDEKGQRHPIDWAPQGVGRVFIGASEGRRLVVQRTHSPAASETGGARTPSLPPAPQ